jgi:hypothetical protein
MNSNPEALASSAVSYRTVLPMRKYVALIQGLSVSG